MSDTATSKRIRPVYVLIYAACVMAVLVAVWLTPRADGNLAILVWPDQSALIDPLQLHRTGADLIGQSRYPFLLIARPNRPDAVARLYENGAILVFNPRFLNACT